MPDRLSSVKDLDFTPRADVTPSPADWRDQVIYQLLVDRFDNNKRNLVPYDPRTAKRGRDPRQGEVFQGGNLKGIARRLDYIKKLGCTAIWISPPFKNRAADEASYHGYAIQDFLEIDPRFGTTQDLVDLVQKAHKKGIYVILDIVINHTGDVWAYPNDEALPYHENGRYDFGFWRRASPDGELQPDDGIWPIELQHPDAFKRRGHIRDMATASDEESVNGDFFSLKELDLDNQVVLNALIRCYKYWIAVADVDGFRIDTVKHVEPRAMKAFCNAIHEYALKIGKRNFLMFGEIVGDDDLLNKYIGRNTPVDGADEKYPLLDAALDFPLYMVLEEAIKGLSGSQALRDRYDQFRNHYRHVGEAARNYITFVDNHDQFTRPFKRFMNGVDDARQAILAIGYLMTNLGIPCIYYGTEQGFDGGGENDHYVREAMFGGKWGAFDTTGMHFFNEGHPIYDGICRIAEVRAATPELRYGRQYFRDISGDGEHFGCPTDGRCTLAFSRILDTDEVLCCFNLEAKVRHDWIAIDANLTAPGTRLKDALGNAPDTTVESLKDGTAVVRVKLKAREMAIFEKA